MSTVVFVHAHPDDEVLLTGGTMAQLAASGHRVVLVTATDGAAGLTSLDLLGTMRLGVARSAELHRAGAILGCARVERLGYDDSGSSGSPAPGSFADQPPEEPAHRLAELLVAERANVVVGYDPAGGYGHPDHRQVHRIVRIAAAIAETPRVLEATVDRRALQRALRLVAPFTAGDPDYRADHYETKYSAAADITHCVDVRRQLAAKRAAMLAHVTQRTGGGQLRSLERFLRLPRPVFSLCFGREWFVEVGAPVPSRRRDHVLSPA